MVDTIYLCYMWMQYMEMFRSMFLFAVIFGLILVRGGDATARVWCFPRADQHCTCGTLVVTFQKGNQHADILDLTRLKEPRPRPGSIV